MVAGQPEGEAEGRDPGPWREYVVSETHYGRMVCSGRYKYCVYESGQRRETLVDLTEAPGETKTSTNVLGASWRLTPAKGVKLNADYRHGDVERPLMIVNGALAKVFVLRHDGTDFTGWPVSLYALGKGSPAVGDVDGAGTLNNGLPPDIEDSNRLEFSRHQGHQGRSVDSGQ